MCSVYIRLNLLNLLSFFLRSYLLSILIFSLFESGHRVQFFLCSDLTRLLSYPTFESGQRVQIFLRSNLFSSVFIRFNLVCMFSFSSLKTSKFVYFFLSP